MKHYLTIDGGTTNTRLILMEDLHCVDRVKIPAGAGNTDRASMIRILRENITEMLARHSLQTEDITAILASGMITSEKGLCEVPHTAAPAGAAELHAHMHSVNIPELSPLPITFISGVRMMGDTPETADIMRGEETELIGLQQQIQTGKKDTVFVLPGSHSKIIRVEDGRIVDFSTMLTGELMAAVAHDTILKDALDITQDDIDEEWLFKGYTYARTRGINEALFKVRVLKNQLAVGLIERNSFFYGTILQGEIDRIVDYGAECILIGGRASFRIPMTSLLRRLTDAPIIPIEDAQADNAPSIGMIRVYEYGSEQ